MAQPLILSLDVQTKSAQQSLDSFRKKVRSSFTSNDTKSLEQNIKNTTKEINKLEGQIERTKQKLRDLGQSDVKPKSVVAMEKELATLEKQLQKTDAEFEKLSKEQADLAGRQVPGLTLEQSLTPEQYARFQELDNLIIKNGEDTEQLTNRINELKSKLAEVKGNSELTEEGKKYNQELDEATKELDNQRQKLQQLQGEMSNTTQTTAQLPKAFESAGKVLKRIQGLIKRVFFFTIITKALRSLKETLSGIISQNSALQSSLNQIRGNLLTAFAPIWQTILPWLQTFMNVLAKVTGYVAAFISMLMGKSVKASQSAAKALQQQAAAAKSAGGASKKAADETEKSTLAFDELNTIATPKEDTSGGGGGGGASTPTFETTDVEITDELMERLKSILVLVGTIGGALLAWKITGFVQDLLKGGENAELLKAKLKGIAGWAMIIGGAILLIKNYSDAWVNGLDWGNFLGIIAGLALLVSGLVLVLGASVAPFALIGAGLAALVLGIKDFIENGASFQNILLIIIGLAAIFAAVWLLASAPIALIVVAIAALIAIFVILWNKCEGFREFWIGLWEKIKTTAQDVWNNYLKPVIDYIWQGIQDLWENHIKPIWEEHLKPAIEAMGQKMTELWETVIQPVLGWIGEKLEWLWNNIFKPVIAWFVGVFVESFKNAWDNIKEAIQIAADFIGGIIDSIKQIFTGIIDFITGVFTGDWEKAWEGLKSVFKGIINGIITIFESMINFVINGINKFIGGLDAVVSKVGEIFGADWSVPTIPTISLPRLAQGAVLPPNQPFLAMVGDQKHGTNIEAPLSTIEEAVENVLNKRGYTDNQTININFTGNLSQLARVLNPVIEKEKNRGSTKLVKGGAY